MITGGFERDLLKSRFGKGGVNGRFSKRNQRSQNWLENSKFENYSFSRHTLGYILSVFDFLFLTKNPFFLILYANLAYLLEVPPVSGLETKFFVQGT